MCHVSLCKKFLALYCFSHALGRTPLECDRSKPNTCGLRRPWKEHEQETQSAREGRYRDGVFLPPTHLPPSCAVSTTRRRPPSRTGRKSFSGGAGPHGRGWCGKKPCQRGRKPQADNRRDHRGQRHFKKKLWRAQRAEDAGGPRGNGAHEPQQGPGLLRHVQARLVLHTATKRHSDRRRGHRVAGQVASRRPTYGTRRMDTQMARETGIPTNRKKIQRIYRKIGWIRPQKSKKEIICASGRRRFKPSGPNQLLADGHHLHPLRRRRMVLLLQRSGCLHPAVGGLPQS